MEANVEVSYDRKADKIYIYLSDKDYSYDENLDAKLRIDYAKDGTPIGIELLCISEGVTINDLPNRAEVKRFFRDHGIKICD
jgi:uncharacterized protein YuzE